MGGAWSKVPLLGRLWRVFQSSLRDDFPMLSAYPALEALGYFRGSLRDPAPQTKSRSHQTKAGGRGAHAIGLRKLASDADGLVGAGFTWMSMVWQGAEIVLASLSGARWFAEFDLFDVQRLEDQAVRRWFVMAGFVAGGFGGQGHGNVDVLEDAARGDAEDAVGGFDEVVAFASAVLAAEVVDEAESGTELFGFDQGACAVRLPFQWFHGALTRERVAAA
jgi:hypothetical protein